MRYRLYSAWGLSTLDIAAVVAVNAVSLWLGIAGMVALGGLLTSAEVGRMLGIPVGIVTALAGAPFFLWVLRHAKNQGFW